MSDDREREDYDALLKAPGWLRFVHAQREKWTDDFSGAAAMAVSDRDDAIALQKLRQVLVARQAVLAALDFPKERLRQLDDAATARTLDQYPPLSRRGSL